MKKLLMSVKSKLSGVSRKRRSRRAGLMPFGSGREAGILAGAFINMITAVFALLFIVEMPAAGFASVEVPEETLCISQSAERRYVIPCGTPFGIKMLTDGVVVTDFGAVNGRISQRSPAEAAGIRRGDIITEVNGIKISGSDQLSQAVQSCPTGCTINVIRDGEKMTFTADALIAQDESEYKLGMWTKDSIAGIGTMTYYDPETGMFAGLGHGISDTSSGVILPLQSGEITAVTITDVVKGASGIPGELCGAFISNTRTGKLTLNSEFGVFGICESSPILCDPMEIAHKDEVKTGSAVIYSTTSGMMPDEYSIEIISIDEGSESPVKNMTIRITDERLLTRTGGIVQGMSGSPIIQNGRLVGAITHVLVSDASTGYAVFAENMTEEYDKSYTMS